MPNHYFERNGEPGKLAIARKAYRENGDLVPFLSELYSVYGTKEWQNATMLQKLWSAHWAFRLLAALALFGTDSTDPDKCDVVSTVLLRIGQKTGRTFLFRRAKQLAEQGLDAANAAEEEVEPHTVPLLLNTIARCQLALGEDPSGVVTRAQSLAPQIEHPDQKSRVYRALADILSLQIDDRAHEMLREMDAAIVHGARWHNTAEKNSIMRRIVQRRMYT